MKTLTSVIAVVSLLVCTAALANDIDPWGFEKDAFISSKSRAEVVADMKAAQAAGEMLAPGEVGLRVADAPSIKPRAQVVAETLEAKRLGLITYGEAAQKEATPAQERQIAMAGLRAVERIAAAKRATGQAGS